MRNKNLDAVKAVAACFVVFIHVGFPGETGQIIKVIARFAVPFFFMISGYFCYYAEKSRGVNCCDAKRYDVKHGDAKNSDEKKKKNITDKIILKICHILRLFLIAVLFYIIWEVLMTGIEEKSIFSRMQEAVESQHIKEFIRYNSTSQIRAHLWFLPALLYCYVLDYFIEKFHLRKLAYACIPVLLGILLWRAEICRMYGGFYHTMEYRNYLYTGMPFYLLGQMLHECQGKWRQEGKILPAGIVVGAVISIGEYHWQDAREIYVGTCVMLICLFVFIILSGGQRKSGTETEDDADRINRSEEADMGVATISRIYISGIWKKAEQILMKTGEKYAFVLYLCHPAVADCVKLLADFLKVSDNMLYRWTRPLLVLGITVTFIFFVDFLRCRFCSSGEKCGIVISKPYRK